MPDVMSDGASPEALLEARGIVRSFGEVRALGGVDLTLNAGKVHALLGVNGAGKTTLMRILCGLDAPSSGSVRATSSAPLPKIVGYCPQELTIWGDLTALEQVVMLGMLHCQPGERAREKKKKVHERALTLLDALGLTSRTGDLAAHLSGGMKRRLSIAMALVHDPSVLILDEPEVGLDPQSRVNLRAFIAKLAREENKAVLLSTHGIDEVERVADDVVIMDRGEVIARGTPDGLVRSLEVEANVVMDFAPRALDGERGQVLLGALEARFGQVTRAELRISCPIASSTPTESLAEVAAFFRDLERELHPEQVSIARPDLEDVFLAKTGRRIGS